MPEIKPIMLTEEEKKVLIDLEDTILLVEHELLRAERAGIDVTDLKTELQKAVKLREGLLREYT